MIVTIYTDTECDNCVMFNNILPSLATYISTSLYGTIRLIYVNIGSMNSSTEPLPSNITLPIIGCYGVFLPNVQSLEDAIKWLLHMRNSYVYSTIKSANEKGVYI